MNSGSNTVHSTRGNAHSLSDKNQEEEGDSRSEDKEEEEETEQDDGAENSGKTGKEKGRRRLTHQRSTDGKSTLGAAQKTIEEEEYSVYSQTIGSLVSYTINYMEKGTVQDAGGQSSRHDEDRINEVDHSDSDDHSLLAEKEDSHSDIDTIEEEVDLSSEGSDHEE